MSELTIKILVVDDHQIIRDGIVSLLEDETRYDVVAQANNGVEALEQLNKQQIDFVIMDLNMPLMDGIETTKLIKSDYEFVKVLILTMLDEDEHIKAVLGAGADGYILKSSGKKELIEAINSIMTGKYFFSEEATKTIMMDLVDSRKKSKPGPKQTIRLTEREIEILHLIVKENTNQEIADELFISVRTVDAHRRNLMDKIGARNTAGLVKYAVENTMNN